MRVGAAEEWWEERLVGRLGDGGSLGQKVPMTKSPNALAPSHNLYCTHENSIPFLHRDLAAAHDVHAYEMHANEVHAHNVHTSEVTQ